MRIAFQPLSESEFEQLLRSDETYAYTTRGHGLSDINVFSTRRRLRHGHGFIRNLIANYGPKLIPMIKKYLFPATKSFATNIASDVLNGEKLKTSFKKRGRQAAKDLAVRVVSGKGIKRRRTQSRTKSVKRHKKSVARKPVEKNRKKRSFLGKKKKVIRKRRRQVSTKKRGVINKDIFS